MKQVLIPLALEPVGLFPGGERHGGYGVEIDAIAAIGD